MTKDELRKTYLARRLALPAANLHSLNQRLANVFFESIDLSLLHTIHIFLPIVSKKEPDSRLIIDKFQKMNPQIRLVVPRVSGNELINYFYDQNTPIEINAWGIPEPVSGRIASADEIDAVLVPLLAYDEEGHRVGYGKGYYDRFLKHCRKDCLKIGISFFGPEKKIMDRTGEDVLLDFCVTPERCYAFNV
jgi:5-formyltetrahydrofolate cyclo-ligase